MRRAKSRVISEGKIRSIHLLEELVGQAFAAQTVDERLAELLQTGESPVGGELGAVEVLLHVAVHQNLEERRRRFRSWGFQFV